MFRKLVSRISFSPALVGQLGFYAKRLRKEETTRKLGLIFTVLALIVQSFAVFSPPESANAASDGDFVRGGVSSLGEYLTLYDNNSNNLKDIFTSAGIKREEIASAKYSTYNSKETITHGRTSQFSAAQGEKPFMFYKENGDTGNVYAKPQSLWDTTAYKKQNGTNYYAWVGYSEKVGWFAIAKHCGNLVTKEYLAPAVAPTCPEGTIGTPPECTVPPAPIALCEGLTVEKIDRTSIRLTASGSIANGAVINGYTFNVSDSSGLVYSKKVDTSSRTATSEIITLEDSSRYKATATVHTSLGDITAADCVKPFVIEEPDACPLNPDLSKDDIDCQPCAGDSTIWVKDENCVGQIINTKTAQNITQSLSDASLQAAMSSDKILYSLTIENVGKSAVDAPVVENLADVLEYAQLVDNGGGVFDQETKTLSWAAITLQPGESQKRDFLVQIHDDIPSTPQGQSDRISYDCVMTNSFGNTVNISVSCPTTKIIESVVSELPQTGAQDNLLFAGGLLAIVTFFYARARQIKQEVRLIRRDLNAGTI